MQLCKNRPQTVSAFPLPLRESPFELLEDLTFIAIENNYLYL